MAHVWLLALFILSACNVAEQPSTAALEDAGVTTSTPATTVSFAQVHTSRAEGGPTMSFPVSISAVRTSDTVVSYSVSGTTTGGGACGAGIDYVTPSGSVTIPAGSTTAQILVTPCTDIVYEGDETFILTLTGTSPALGLGAYGALTVRILESRAIPQVGFASVSSASQVEGVDGASTVVTVNLTLSHASVQAVSATVISGGEATEGDDFTLSASSVSFAAGATTASVNVTILGDDFIEPNENIMLTLSEPVNGALGTTYSHTLQITADEVPAPMTAQLGVAGPVTEAAGTVLVPVTVVGRMQTDLVLRYVVDTGATVTGPAQLATLGSDYSISGGGSSGTLTIADDPAVTRVVYIPVTIVNDSLYEPTEEFVITLIGASDVTILGTSARVSVTDNDTAPSVAFLTVSQSVLESNTPGGVVVRLVNGSGNEVAAGRDMTVTFTTTNNDTEGASDWALGVSSLTIPAGSSRATLPLSAVVDDVDEDDEYFDVAFNTYSTGYAGAAGLTSHRVTILDGTPAARLSFTASDSAQTETDASAALTSMTVQLDRASERAITLQYSASGTTLSTAACGAGHDISSPGTLSIPAGSPMPFTITGINLCGDTLYRGSRSAVFTLQGATNAVLGAQHVHTVAVTDNDAVPNVAVSAAITSFDEADTQVSFTVTVQPTAKPFNLTYGVTGTATVRQDHTFSAQRTLAVPASSVVAVYTLSGNIVDDTTPENAETIIMNILASSVDANVTVAAVTVTINASDPLQLALGSRHACGLLSGAVKCWGYGPVLGQGLTANHGDAVGETASALLPISLGTGFTPSKVIAGKDFSCALSTAGTVKCWGLNTLGQLGRDQAGVSGQTSEFIGDAASEMGSALPTLSLGATVVDIQTSAEASHACALFVSGRMKCWGSNASGQLGYSVTAGTCSDGVPDTTCYGDDFAEISSLAYLTFPTAGLTVERMAVGDDHTCAHTSDDEIYCWGANTNGALGADSASATIALSSAVPVALHTNFDVADLIRLSAGQDHSCADFLVGAAHESVCWGTGANGVLGQGTTTNAGTVANTLAAISTPIDYGVGLSTITGLRIANTHACLRANTGATVCWGANGSSQLGTGVAGPILNPAAGTSLGSYSDVYVGTDFGCAVSGAFQYTCWGNNGSGRLGRGSASVTLVPGAAADFL